MEPKVTVLMPVYNAEAYLKDSIDSVLHQTFTEFELLIIDDGSTDRSIDIINEYADSRIRLIRNEENLGLVKTLNKGLKAVKGFYIARMDADDIAHPNRLAMQFSIMETNKEIGLCGTWLSVMSTGKIYSYPESHEEIKSSLLFYSALGHPTVMIRRNILTENHIEYNNVYAEDYDLWVRLSRVTKAYNIQSVLLEYRIHEAVDRFSNKYKIEQLLAARKVREDQLLYNDFSLSNDELDVFHKIADGNFALLESESIIATELLSRLMKKDLICSTTHQKITLILLEYNNSIERKLRELKKITETDHLYVWGTGEKAERDMKLLALQDIHITAFIDNDYRKIGKTFLEREIISGNQISDSNAAFLVSSMYVDEISQQIVNLGYSKERIYSFRQKQMFY